MSNTPTAYGSESTAHAPLHGGYPGPEPTMAECATRLGFATVAEMTDWLQRESSGCDR